MKRLQFCLSRIFPAMVIAIAGYFLFHAGVALAETAPAAPAAVSFLDKLTSLILSWQGLTTSLAVVSELVFRLIPTQAPLSWAWILSGAMHSTSKLLEAAAEFMDKILPQNLK